MYGWTRKEFISEFALNSSDLRAKIGIGSQSQPVGVLTEGNISSFKIESDLEKTESVYGVERNSDVNTEQTGNRNE